MKIIYGQRELIKLCPRCGRSIFGDWQVIQAAFGRNKARRDGLQVHCRECRKTEAALRRHKP